MSAGGCVQEWREVGNKVIHKEEGIDKLLQWCHNCHLEPQEDEGGRYCLHNTDTNTVTRVRKNSDTDTVSVHVKQGKTV